MKSDHNTQARLYNAFITSRQTPLDAMKTLADTVPASFPINTAQLATMSGTRNLSCIRIIDYTYESLATQLLTLSRAYNLPENGTVDEQRSRFRRFIGVVRTV